MRPLTETEVPAVVELLAAVAAEGRWLGTEAPVDRERRAEQLRADLAAAAGVAHLVAVVDDRIVGHLGLELAATGVASLGMFVTAEWRGRGVGTALVTAAVEQARRWGAHKVALQLWPHNRPALALYRKLGFVEEGRLRRHYRRRDGALWDALVMGLVLDEGSPGSPYEG
ncbi:MAG TPA: GNAT family N-acetyltransferase [Acidimicrobiales bacterium]|nr:GNAT family N-acetyltransferase [Acidimicrobiales bacterium]